MPPQKVNNKNLNRGFFQPMEATHVSQFFNEHKKDILEHKTIQSLTDESIVLSGYMVYYIFRTFIDIDEVLFEPNTSSFDEAFQIAVTFPDYVMGWDNADALLSKFGVQTNAQGEFILSQRAWDKIMEDRKSKGLFTYHRPREGDLILMFDNQRWEKENPIHDYSTIAVDENVKQESRDIFQINYVNVGKNSWQFGKDYVWRVSASQYKYDESESLNALSDDALPLFDNPELEFNFTEQDEAFELEESDIREFDENNPFLGY